MKIVLLLCIKCYWYIIPETKRNKCIFRESCSCYVFRLAKERGFIQGIKALWFRYKNCRSNYIITHTGEQTLLITSSHLVVQENEIRESLILNN